MFAINRFANVNMHDIHNTVEGRPSQLLDLLFDMTCLKHNH